MLILLRKNHSQGDGGADSLFVETEGHRRNSDSLFWRGSFLYNGRRFAFNLCTGTLHKKANNLHAMKRHLLNKALFVSYRSIQSLQRIGNNCNAVSDCPTSWSCKASCATSAREPSLPTAARTRRGSWSSRRVRSGYS